MPDKPTTLSFTDVNESDWFYEDIEKAVERGFVQGYPDGTFGPDKLPTRAEIAVMMNRVYEKIMREIEGRI